MLLYQLNTVYDRSFGCQVVVVVPDIKVLCHLFIGCPQTVIFRERSFPSTGPTGRSSLPLNILTTKSTPAFRQVLNSQVFKNSSPSRYHSIHIITHCTCIFALPVTHYAILFLSQCLLPLQSVVSPTLWGEGGGSSTNPLYYYSDILWLSASLPGHQICFIC